MTTKTGNTMTAPWTRAVLVVATVAMATMVLLAGCSAQQDSDTARKATSVSIVVGNTMGCAPADPALFADLILEAVQTNGSIDVIVADGSPTSVLGGMQRGVGSTAKNDRKRSMENAATVQAIIGAVRGARPAHEEADLLGAITLARRELVQCEGDRLVVVVCASGLSTSGLLDFTKQGLLAAEPTRLLELCESELPDLSGVEVELYGLGDVVEPQENLPESVARNLKGIYTVLLEACGTKKVSVSDAAPTATSALDGCLPYVTPVSIPNIDVFVSSELPERIELDEETVAFVGDTDDFAYPESALLVLSRIASGMESSPLIKVSVVGSAAGYPSDREWAQRLSEARAEAVARALQECGVSENRITCYGIGDGSGYGVEHVDDLDTNGLQIPKKAGQNRKVTLIFET